MQDINLNIGCGSHKMKGYIGIDLYPISGVGVIARAHRLPFPLNSASHVYTQHLVEHLAPAVFNKSIIDWHRVLKPDGKLTIRCPNFEYWVRRWLEAPDEERWPNLLNAIIGNADRGDGHLMRNAFTLDRLLAIVDRKLFQVILCHMMCSRYGVHNADCYYEAVAI